MPQLNLKAACLAGLASGTAYAITAEIDNRLSGQNLDDLKLLGRPLVKSAKYAKLAGVPVHLLNSIVIASIFPMVRRVLPGSGVVQGMAFATIENTVLYPVAAFEHMHPGIQRGEIDRYFTLKAYLLSIPRHLAFGATLGFLYDRLNRA